MEHPKSPFDDNNYDVIMDTETIALMRIAQNPELAPIALSENKDAIEQDIYLYIRSKRIIEGTKKIPSYIIFDDYTKWSSVGSRISKVLFSRYFNQVFTPKRTSGHKFYTLDPAPFDLHETYSMWTDPVIMGKPKKKKRVVHAKKTES